MGSSYTPKLKVLLRRSGASFHRQGKGSHEGWLTAGGVFVVVPSRCKNRHTANGILKQAGLPKAF